MKKWLLIILISVALLIIGVGYFYYQKQIPKFFTEREFKNCHASFDLNKLDFTKPIWNSELSIILPDLMAMQAFNEKNIDKCNYFEGLKEINSNLTIENCQRTYNFLDLTERLQEGMDCQDYIKECKNKNVLEIEVENELIEKAKEIVCQTYCQSFKNKAALIAEPENLCEEQPAGEAIDYLDAETNQLKPCTTGLADEIKFIIAVANYIPSNCLTINTPETQRLCQFYFERETAYLKYRNEFEQKYCGLFVGKTINPSQ